MKMRKRGTLKYLLADETEDSTFLTPNPLGCGLLYCEKQKKKF